jgi:hypothetical protein
MPVEPANFFMSWKVAGAALWMATSVAFYSTAHCEDVKADAEFLEYLGRMESADTNWTEVADGQDGNAASKPIKESDSKRPEPDKHQAADQR